MFYEREHGSNQKVTCKSGDVNSRLVFISLPLSPYTTARSVLNVFSPLNV